MRKEDAVSLMSLEIGTGRVENKKKREGRGKEASGRIVGMSGIKWSKRSQPLPPISLLPLRPPPPSSLRGTATA